MKVEMIDYVSELRRISREIMNPALGTRPDAYDGQLIKEAAFVLERLLADKERERQHARDIAEEEIG